MHSEPPGKFEAGTPGIVQTIGLGVALEYMMALGMENIAAHEHGILAYATAKLSAVDAVGGFTTTARQKCEEAGTALNDFIRRQVDSVVAADR